MTTVPAAVVKAGDTVRIPAHEPAFIVRHVHYGDPKPGKIRWEVDGLQGGLGVSARLRVDVLAWGPRHKQRPE